VNNREKEKEREREAYIEHGGDVGEEGGAHGFALAHGLQAPLRLLPFALGRLAPLQQLLWRPGKWCGARERAQRSEVPSWARWVWERSARRAISCR
jgi:hypothetical protein